jgi:hypothetical protein
VIRFARSILGTVNFSSLCRFSTAIVAAVDKLTDSLRFPAKSYTFRLLTGCSIRSAANLNYGQSVVFEQSRDNISATVVTKNGIKPCNKG